MGIIWNPAEKAWQTGVYHLKTYNLQNDNGNVPYSFICEDGFMLGEWLRGQLRKYKAGTLSEERINILKENGVSL